MKLKIKATDETVEVKDMGKAHAMMADDVAVRQVISDVEAPKKAKK